MGWFQTQRSKIFPRVSPEILKMKIYDSTFHAMGTIDDFTERHGRKIMTICPRHRSPKAAFTLEVPFDAIRVCHDKDGEAYALVEDRTVGDALRS